MNLKNYYGCENKFLYGKYAIIPLRLSFVSELTNLFMLQEYIAGQFESYLLQLKNDINSYTHKENIGSYGEK
jgi:hypothetical protein